MTHTLPSSLCTWVQNLRLGVQVCLRPAASRKQADLWNPPPRSLSLGRLRISSSLSLFFMWYFGGLFASGSSLVSLSHNLCRWCFSHQSEIDQLHIVVPVVYFFQLDVKDCSVFYFTRGLCFYETKSIIINVVVLIFFNACMCRFFFVDWMWPAGCRPHFITMWHQGLLLLVRLVAK